MSNNFWGLLHCNTEHKKRNPSQCQGKLASAMMNCFSFFEDVKPFKPKVMKYWCLYTGAIKNVNWIDARKQKNQFRKHFVKYTRQAFQIFLRINDPNILDVCCGSGIATIELSKLSDGKRTGIDTDQKMLNKLNEQIKKEGLSNSVFTKKCSLYEITFPDETFDIIWAEGIST